DWPPQLSADLGKRVDSFRNQHCEIRPIAAESAEWNGVFHGWCTDLESATAIAEIFSKHFGDRLLWVKSGKGARGRIAAICKVESGAAAARTKRRGRTLSRLEGFVGFRFRDLLRGGQGEVPVLDPRRF